MARRAVAALLALLLAAPAAATSPGGAHAPVLVRVCFNEQLGPRDGGHFSLVLVRELPAVVPEAVLRLEPVPWRRCVLGAARGEFDAVLGASHTPERARDLAYPLGADGAPDAASRLFAQAFRLVRPRGAPAAWEGGRFVGLHGPIGTERGHAAAAFARAHGAAVDDDHPDLRAMLAKLRAGRLAGALVSEPQLATLSQDAGLWDGLEAVQPPVFEQPYFLAFSQAFASRHPGLVYRLWSAIPGVRERPEIRRVMADQQGGGRAVP